MRIFWPVFLAVALLSIVAMWFVAPAFRTSVPEGLRSNWANGWATLKGMDIDNPVRVQDGNDGDESTAEVAVAEPQPQPSASPSPRAVPARRPESTASRPSASAEQEAQTPVAQTAAQDDPEPYDPIPSTLGIMQTDYRDATWGIVNAVTPYKSLADGEVLGNAGVGTVFLVEQRQPAGGGGAEFVGNFRNHRLDEPVVISAANIYCFKGSYDSLNARQKAALTSYYKARAEAERIKRDILKESGSKSPYFAKAVAAKAKWDEMVKTTEELEVALRTDKHANASQIRDKLARMKGEMAVLKSRVKDLSDRHKAWKEKNAPNMPDPEDDPRVQKLREEMQKYAKPIPGLAF